jgi:hypothetical protein
MIPSKIFQEQNYLIVDNFIPKTLANFLYSYVKMSAQVSATCGEKYGHEVYKHKPNMLGDWFDPMAPGVYTNYGDVMTETLLKDYQPKLEKIIDIDLVPTYSFLRLYQHGSELKMHKDRPSCEISVTLCLGYDSNYNWPMYVEAKPIELEPGDIIVYKGENLKHGRDVFKGQNHAQCFLHYNDKNGPFKETNKYDLRPHLGLPAEFNTSTKLYLTEEYD